MSAGSAPKDPSIDIIGMDVIWTGEFANAGWIEPWTGDEAARSRRRRSSRRLIETAEFEGKLYAAPFNTNTQLLWYRKDRSTQPPKTWDEMIEEAKRLEEGARSRSRRDRYEGFMVWVNALIEAPAARSSTGPERSTSTSTDRRRRWR